MQALNRLLVFKPEREGVLDLRLPQILRTPEAAQCGGDRRLEGATVGVWNVAERYRRKLGKVAVSIHFEPNVDRTLNFVVQRTTWVFRLFNGLTDTRSLNRTFRRSRRWCRSRSWRRCWRGHRRRRRSRISLHGRDRRLRHHGRRHLGRRHISLLRRRWR